MNSTIWLALALVLVLEGLGPLLYPRAWRKMVASLSQLPDNLQPLWRRTCGCRDCDLLHVEEIDWLIKKWSDLPYFGCKKVL